jgi:hypothetical protein
LRNVIEQAPDAQSGNTTVIIGDRQVFVVDTCFRPSAAREDIAQIRSGQTSRQFRA